MRERERERDRERETGRERETSQNQELDGTRLTERIREFIAQSMRDVSKRAICSSYCDDDVNGRDLRWRIPRISFLEGYKFN